MAVSTEKTAARDGGVWRLIRRFALPVLIAVGGVLTAFAWIVSSPTGGGPDDVYHEASIWCPAPIGAHCTIDHYVNGDPKQPVVVVPAEIAQAGCFAFQPDVSAACDNAVDPNSTALTSQVNVGQYPGWYYRVMHVFTKPTISVDTVVLLVRAMNALIAAVFFGLLAWLLPRSSRRLLVYLLVGFSVPLLVYFLTSINPSSWGITGVVTAWFGLVGLFATRRAKTPPWRRRMLAVLAVAGVVLAAMARTDCATYSALAVIAVGAFNLPELKPKLWRSHRLEWITMLVVFVIGIAGTFGGSQTSMLVGSGRAAGGFGLLATNIVGLPSLLIGYWTDNLGWFDVPLPALATVPAMMVGIGLIFTGLRRMNWTKALAAGGVVLVFIGVPLFTLQMAGYQVGQDVQPRYLAPILLLLAGTVLTRPRKGGARSLSLAETWIAYVLLVGAHCAALQSLIRRYVFGTDVRAVNLNAGAEWWRPDMPSPMVVWLLGSLGFALLALLLFVVRGRHIQSGSVAAKGELAVAALPVI